jgi:hypothetical protein
MSDYSCNINLLTALDWQRSNADNFKAFIQAKHDWYQTNFCDEYNNFFDDVFNLDTANDFGLSIWSIILDEKIFGESQPARVGYPAFGFGPNKKNFNNGNFSPGAGGSYSFSTEEKRILLKLKAYILHMSGPVSGGSNSINQSLFRIFDGKKITCIDNRDMTFTYLLYDATLAGFAIELFNRDLLPRPACIDISLVLKAGVKAWGFGPNRSNFNNGNFYNGEIIGS